MADSKHRNKSISEEPAAAAMKAGARDYLMKDNLTRLIPAIERELRDARNRHVRRKHTNHFFSKGVVFMAGAENVETQGQKIEKQPLRILVVEDDREIREMVALMVRGMGYTIATAATGKEALARLREQMADIVLLDLMMPEMDGFEFCRAVQGDPALRNLYIILTSARDTLEDKVKGLDLGASDYLTKPFSMTELQARIKVWDRMVRSRRSLEEIVEKIKQQGNAGLNDQTAEWDVFVCHASEDKDSIARPLAESLRQEGLKVWYDEFTLTLGDSLRRSIEMGLNNSKYGIVILSPSFFRKEWPQRELDGLVAREVSGGKTILPIWHDVTHKDILNFSSPLADKLGIPTSKGIDSIVKEILRLFRFYTPHH